MAPDGAGLLSMRSLLLENFLTLYCLSFLVLSRRVVSCRFDSYRVMSCRVVSCRFLPWSFFLAAVRMVCADTIDTACGESGLSACQFLPCVCPSVFVVYDSFSQSVSSFACLSVCLPAYRIPDPILNLTTTPKLH